MAMTEDEADLRSRTRWPNMGVLKTSEGDFWVGVSDLAQRRLEVGSTVPERGGIGEPKGRSWDSWEKAFADAGCEECGFAHSPDERLSPAGSEGPTSTGITGNQEPTR